MIKKQIFCLVGETNSGKDTIAKKICDIDTRFKPIVSYTTRPKRETETEGIEHYFVSEEYIDNIMTNHEEDVAGYTKISKDLNSKGYKYLTTRKDLEDGNIYIIDPLGIDYLRSKFGDIYEIIAFYIYTPLAIREERAKKRSDYNEEFAKRVENESVQFDHYYRHRKYDYIIYNLDNCLDASVTSTYGIMKYILEGGLRREHTTSLGNIYAKKDIYDALTYLKMVFTFYKNNYVSPTLILKDISKGYELIRNILLSHIK